MLSIGECSEGRRVSRNAPSSDSHPTSSLGCGPSEADFDESLIITE